MVCMYVVDCSNLISTKLNLLDKIRYSMPEICYSLMKMKLASGAERLYYSGAICTYIGPPVVVTYW